MSVTVLEVRNYFESGVSAKSIGSFFETYGFEPETILAYFKVVDDLPFPAGPVIPRPVRKELLSPICPEKGVLWKHRQRSHRKVFATTETNSYVRREYDAPKAKLFIPSFTSWLISKNFADPKDTTALLEAISLISPSDIGLKEIKKPISGTSRSISGMADKSFYDNFEAYSSVAAQKLIYENEKPEFKRRLAARVFYCTARSWIKVPDKTTFFNDDKHLIYLLKKALDFIDENSTNQSHKILNEVSSVLNIILKDMLELRWRAEETIEKFLDTGVKKIDDEDLNIKATMPESHIPGIIAQLNAQGFNATHMWAAYFLAREVVSLLTDPSFNFKLCSECSPSFARFFERINNKTKLKQNKRHEDFSGKSDPASWMLAKNMRKTVSYYFGWKVNQPAGLGSFPEKPIHFCLCQHGLANTTLNS
jgi:hypothetical protein